MLRKMLAERLRGLAQALDGRQQIDFRWHKLAVMQMNSYIERTEIELRRLREKCNEPQLHWPKAKTEDNA